MKNYFIILLFLFSLNLISCSETTQIVKMQSKPLTPFVLDQDFTDNSGSGEDNVVKKTYQANLTRFKFQIKNNHTKIITIVGVRFTVTNTSTKEKKIISTSVDQIVTDSTGIEEIKPRGLLTSPERSATVYLDGLPKNRKEGTNVRYNIKAEIQGWVGSAQDPQSRLSAAYYFNTL